jgi:hypothetical protein
VSEIIIQDEGLQAIMDDPKLAAARRKLSFHEIRLIMKHARKCPILGCQRSSVEVSGCPFINCVMQSQKIAGEP